MADFQIFQWQHFLKLKYTLKVTSCSKKLFFAFQLLHSESANCISVWDQAQATRSEVPGPFVLGIKAHWDPTWVCLLASLCMATHPSAHTSKTFALLKYFVLCGDFLGTPDPLVTAATTRKKTQGRQAKISFITEKQA